MDALHKLPDIVVWFVVEPFTKIFLFWKFISLLRVLSYPTFQGIKAIQTINYPGRRNGKISIISNKNTFSALLAKHR